MRTWHNLEPIALLRGDMDRILNNLAFGHSRPIRNGARTTTAPAANLWEDENALHLEMELPGLTIEDLDIALDGDVLTIKAEPKEKSKETNEQESGATFYRRERTEMQFARTFQLPVSVDAERVDAQLKNGVLTVNLPKAASARPRKISVTTH